MRAIILAILLAILMAAPATAAGRVALVIGNGAYAPEIGALAAPANDARAIAALLEKLDFTVFTGIELDRASMEAKLRQFQQAVDAADVALFYYAGHAVQEDGRNYLIPVDARFEDAWAISFETIEAGAILDGLAGDQRVGLAFIDAARDTSFARRTSHERHLFVRGLAEIQLPHGDVLLCFAAAPNRLAVDASTAETSVFSSALLRHLATPGIEIYEVVKRVRGDVAKATDDAQWPWSSSSLLGELYLVPIGPPEPPHTQKHPAES